MNYVNFIERISASRESDSNDNEYMYNEKGKHTIPFLSFS